ncbi:MAG TPA: GNAT family N-acetyltransferase, partial [Planctomycetaceae bacterium]|nr:GNAT family N-acetyltransferase [Planctomycetaceae bacterium]
MSFEIIETFTNQQTEQLTELYQQQWWSKGRTLDDVRKMLAGTQVVLGLVESGTSRLVGFCRVISDGIYRAMLLDVMIDEQYQGRGLGRHLIDVLVSHHQIENVEVIWLCCDPKMIPFYEKWGFNLIVDHRAWMHRLLTDSFPVP